MNIAKYREFAVISFGEKKVCGCIFHRLKTAYSVRSHASAVKDPVDPAGAWKKVFRELSVSKDCPLLLCGALENGTFFRTGMMTLPPKAMKDALQLELTRHVMGDVQNNLLQYTAFPSDTEGDSLVNCYVIPERSLDRLAAMLTQSGRKADHYLYPLLALNPADPGIYLPDTEKNFYFADGEWQIAEEEKDPAGTLDAWHKIFAGLFSYPADFPVDSFPEVLLCARFALSEGFHDKEEGLRVLPDKLRPSRFRTNLQVTAVLVFLLLCNLVWAYSGGWIRSYQSYKFLAREKLVLSAENQKLKAKIRKSEKESKEKARLSYLNPGEHDVVGKLYDLTVNLPANTMVSSLRWNDTGVDIMMFSESSSGISELFRQKFPYWKLANIQQRNFGGAATMITLKLTNTEEKK